MINVLIVDDEILARVGIQSLLENSPEIRVAGAFSLAGDALDFLKTNIVDIVITDIEMPYMNGLEFIKKIREQHLAEGIIILSCYDKFEYAKQAISLGTDGYVLKNSLTREVIEKEIYSVYEKISERGQKERGAKQDEEKITQGGTKVVAVVKMPKNDKAEVPKDKILMKLLSDIVTHYRMGHLIEAYHERNPFVIIEFPREAKKEERKELLEGYLEAIQTNLFQYTNHMPRIGVSGEFCDLQEIPEEYEQAEEALEMRFYKEKKSVFLREEFSFGDKRPGVMFQKEVFLKPEGIASFEKELSGYLDQCRREQIPARTVKEILIQAVSIFVYSIVREYFSDHEIVRWNSRYPFMETVMSAESAKELTAGLVTLMAELKEELLEELNDDGFLDVLAYIDRNRASKISIQELADLKNMSVSLFAKKFKMKTKMAPIQYINQRKIELVKEYLKKREYTLREIAELTGFSNENYMVRVFRKTTGKTITDYRKESIKREK